jgi:hypothetical protein
VDIGPGRSGDPANTGVQLSNTAAQRLLRDRLGWRFQPATASD